VATRSVDNLSQEDLNRLKERLSARVASMSADELRIQTQSRESFTEFLTQIVYEIGFALGWTLIIPAAWIANTAESLITGFGDGVDYGYQSHRKHPRRRHYQ
jgi:SAM-dependent MidA family methyltransferase